MTNFPVTNGRLVSMASLPRREKALKTNRNYKYNLLTDNKAWKRGVEEVRKSSSRPSILVKGLTSVKVTSSKAAVSPVAPSLSIN
jgi:hypothetical protein